MNCFSCDYVEFSGIGVKCNREMLIRNFLYSVEEPELDCPCHSKEIVEETRYGHPNVYRHQSDDVCNKCNRILPRKSDYNIFEDELNNKIKICSFCEDNYGKRKV